MGQVAKSISEVADRLLGPGGGVEIKSHDPKSGRQTFRSVFNDLIVDQQCRRVVKGAILRSLVLKSMKGSKQGRRTER